MDILFISNFIYVYNTELTRTISFTLTVTNSAFTKLQIYNAAQTHRYISPSHAQTQSLKKLHLRTHKDRIPFKNSLTPFRKALIHSREMNRQQILQNLFGEQSEEEEITSTDELNHHTKSVSNEDDGRPELENKSMSESQQGAKLESGADQLKGVHHDEVQSSSRRSTKTEKNEDRGILSAVMHDIFGDSDDDEQAEYGVLDRINQGENRYPEHKVNYEKELKSEDIVCNQLVFEIPRRPSVAHPSHSQMATVKVLNIIGIDPKPFDPATYVQEDLYVTDDSGSKRRVPHTNIIRWRSITNCDGTSSDKKAHKVQHCTTDVDPETVIEQTENADWETTKDDNRLNQKKKKKATHKCSPMDCKEHQLSPSFVEDS